MFHPVIKLPARYEVFDMSRRLPDEEVARHPYGIGKYNEKRVGTYTSPIFSTPEHGARDIHMGIDVFAPQGTPVHAFADGKVLSFGYNAEPGDYGYVLITEHEFQDRALYALHGHLTRASVESKSVGQAVKKSEIIAWIGDRTENGGWLPHLHFQLSYEKPTTHDMPGVVSEADRESALRKYPDPRMVLGPLY